MARKPSIFVAPPDRPKMGYERYLMLMLPTSLMVGLGACALSRPSQCESLLDAEAVSFATSRLNESFGSHPDTMLNGMTAEHLHAGAVSRDHFGDNSPYNSINVSFSQQGSSKVVITARIFPDCEVEWRPS